MNHGKPNDMPDGYLALDREFRVLEMTPTVEQRFFSLKTGAGARELTWPESNDFKQRCHKAMLDQVPAHFDVRWDRHRWVRVHAWPSRRALFVCLRDVTHERPTATRRLGT